MLVEIADKLLRINFEGLPGEAVDTSRDAIFDTIGVTLAGAAEPAVAATTEALGSGAGNGPCTIFGMSVRMSPLDAAMINGVASHALDYDDCSNTLGGHPSAPIVPALWALAEEMGADGKSFIAAYVAGFETETQIGRAVNFHHYEKGWHPTSTLGVFGSAAACAHLMKLDVEKTAAALALAATMSSGMKANFGTMAKPYHVGHCARNGFLAARLARAGMTANPDALIHPQGFFSLYNGAGNFVAERALDGWSDPLDIVETGVAFKRHPCCASTHPAIDALLALRKLHGFAPNDVRHILSWTHPRRLNHTNRPDPVSGLDGKFSVQYVLARALMHGIVSLDHFSDAAVNEGPLRSLMQRISAKPHPDARMDTTEHFFAEIFITLQDGTELHHRVERPVGRDRNHPLPKGALGAKFDDCARRALPIAQSDVLHAALMRLAATPDIRKLSALVQTQACA